jgi:ABC-type antimicrobial peptide transport system permease subunit
MSLDIRGFLLCFTGNMATALTTAIQCDFVSRIRSTRVKPQMQPLVSYAFLSIPFFFLACVCIRLSLVKRSDLRVAFGGMQTTASCGGCWPRVPA